MSGRSKRSRGSTRGKRESESQGSLGRVKRERDREREAEAPSSRGSPVRVKREVEPVSAREAPAPIVPAVRVKREREADEDSEPEREVRAKNGRVDSEDRRSRHCPYLDTINRGLKSHAYIHSVQFSHHVFLNLHTLKFYCLPDNYEIIDSSLEDITYVLKPTFTKQQIANLDKQAKLSRAYDGTTYLPGIVGLNNIKANDYANAVLQALSNVPPLRNYFLEEDNYKNIKRTPGDIMFLLVQRFGELMRKLWNPRNFKAHVSPHEMLQAVVLCSKKTFQITKQGDGVDFLSWFLNALHSALGGTKKKKKTIVTDVFQGSMRIFTKKLPHPDLPAEEKEQLLHNDEYQETMVESTFMYLTLDLPTAPLYKDEKEQLIIPQVPLFNILAKFNGITEKEYKTYKENFLKRFQLTKLPPYLIFCIKRFTKNNFFVEKNPTIVNFPITGRANGMNYKTCR
uniref:ubiquitinyl hydrolase 1 n=1 Tax=Neovison vison TaxID=452646 RepID=A0A8C7BGY2_NEOVI